MNVLALETTGTTCGAAILRTYDDGSAALLALSEVYRPNVHDTQLTENITAALAGASLRMVDVDVVAVSSGPGSFTGLRIGTGLAKGLTFTGTPHLVGVPTLTALAMAATEVCALAGLRGITALIRSHREQWYVQEFSADASPLSTPSLRSTDGIAATLPVDHLVVGPGSEAFGRPVISGLNRLSARFVARASMPAVRAGRWDDPHTFVPAYEQDFVVVERKRT